VPSEAYTISAKATFDTSDFNRGLSSFEKGLTSAQTGFSKYGSEAEKASKQTKGFIDSNKQHMESLGKDAMILGGAMLAGAALAIKAWSDFSGRMAQVQSLSHASATEMQALSSAALTMGTSFGQSANEVADAEIELTKAGLTAKEMLGGALAGALALAAAGQIEVGKATEIATIALTQFNLHGKDVPHVADLLAAGADKALGGVDDLGMGLKQGGQVAASFGLTLEDTVGTLSAFANAGLLGSDAGTSLKTMLIALANPGKQARDTMAELGISAFDTNNKFVGVVSLAQQLHDKLGPLADAQQKAALATIFGTDAIRSSNELMKLGGDGIQKWIKDVNDQGFAAKQAAGKLDSLNGDFKKLQAVFETGLIKMGATGDGFLRPVVQNITKAVKAFGDLPDPVKGGILAFAGFGGAALLLGGFLLTTIPKIYETVKAIEAMAAASPRAAAALSMLGKAALPLAAILTAMLIVTRINDAMTPAAKTTAEYTQKLIELGTAGKTAGEVLGKDMFARANAGKLKPITDEIGSFGEALARINHMDLNDSVNNWLDSIGVDSGSQIKELKATITGIDTAMSDLVRSGSMEIAATNFRKLADDAKAHGEGLDSVAKSFPQYLDALREQASQMKVSLTDQELLNWALGQTPQKILDVAASAEGQAKAAEIAAQQTSDHKKAMDDLGLSVTGAITQLDKLVTSMINSGLITLSARDAARNFESAIDALDDSLKENGATLDITTEKGRKNQAAFDGISSAGLKSAEAMAKNGESQEIVQQQLRNTYDQLIIAAGKFGITGDAADTMARQVMGIPKDVPIDTSIQNYADTMTKAANVKYAVDQIPATKTINIYTVEHIAQVRASGDTATANAMDTANRYAEGKAYATGGAIYGPGPKGIDSKWIKAAPGEHVLSDEDVDLMGGQAAVYAFRQQLHNGSLNASRSVPNPTPVMTTQAQPSTVDVGVHIAGDLIAADPQEAVRAIRTSQMDALVMAGLNNLGG
jgi:TP901 family phage tail tape measure protein